MVTQAVFSYLSNHYNTLLTALTPRTPQNTLQTVSTWNAHPRFSVAPNSRVVVAPHPRRVPKPAAEQHAGKCWCHCITFLT